VSLLTQGLGSLAVGHDSQDNVEDVLVPKWGPSAILTGGLGRRSAQTANYPYFNTPIAAFYYQQKETGDFQFSLAGTAWDQPLEYGRVARTAAGVRIEFQPTVEGAVSAPRPYINYGTSFKSDPMALLQDSFEIKPVGSHRWGLAGDVEYATLNPDANSVYNARSVLIIFPQGVILSPRSVGRLKFYLKKVFPGSINLRVRRDGGKVMIELLNPTVSVSSVQQKVGNVFMDIPLSRRYDVVSHQVYSGME
jgi:hypothetical protein